jgi:predicted transposase/invertase (TIGR01784 family)
VLSKFLDPKNDFAFKKIFGAEKNKDILIHFLNDMVIFPGQSQIQDVTFLKTTQDPETAAQKTSLVDILCRDEEGNSYIVEMQVAKDKGFAKRAQYYASKVYTSQMQKKEEFHDLKEVIFLAIVDFVMFPNKKAYKSDHVILDRESYENDLKDFSFTFLELPKFNKEIEELSNITEKWAYFFKHASETSEDELKQLIGEDIVIERAYEELNRFKWDEMELLTYEQADMQERVYYGTLEQKFEEGFDKGKAQGIEEGFDKGKAQGIEEGFDKGKTQGIEEIKHNIVCRMLQQGIEDTDIYAITGFPLEKLRLLKKEFVKGG